MCKYDTSALRVRIGLTRAGRHSLRQLNSRQGHPAVSFGRIRRDLAEYIERHIDAGDPLISEFDVRYEDGLLLTVYLSHGVYFIKEVSAIGVAIAHKAIWIWQRIKLGCDYAACLVLSGWYFITAPSC